MKFKFTETKIYIIEAESKDEAFDKFSELVSSDEVCVEVIE